MRTKKGWGKRERYGKGLLLPIHTPWQRTRHQKGATHKRTQVPNPLIGYQGLGALNALRHPRVLSGAVVTARTIEIIWSNWVQTYKGLSTKEPKEKNTRFAFL